MNFIVAVTENYGIGKNNDLLFKIPADLAYFKEKTINKILVMGENTYYSLPKRPLPNRINIVLSDNPNFNEKGVVIVRSLDELFAQLENYKTEDVFVGGGASVYNLLMEYCEKAYITKIKMTVPADVYINNIEKMGCWQKVWSGEESEFEGVKYQFQIFKNKNIKKF